MADDSGLSIDGPETLRGALVVLVFGCALAGYGVYDYVQQDDAVRDAVEVDATITDVGVETRSTTGSSDVEYQPTVRYSYEYEGESYAGTDLFAASIPPSYDTESAAEEVVAGYETGETVTAYVPPDDPNDAFVRTERSNSPLLAAGIGGILALLGGASAAKRVTTRSRA
ncbi:Protein of unknown function [Halogranum gelatinilyticum]|uniref:DUF3592 domain-containing protein n=1 Tax=Halogranum gelatinilyticum TaxID=660521 RepID=A0A1G9XPD9_9EURY|nr:DUF3592 domain-containing protein [Halogranum gelatinilyticum]SDM98113.1 Protein of unknown function [Halogranum gelatinilyticum]